MRGAASDELEWNDAGGESTEITERERERERERVGGRGGETRWKKESEKGIYVTKAEGRSIAIRKTVGRQVGLHRTLSFLGSRSA